MTKEQFKEKWESGEDGGGITFDDVAKCARAWGLYATPKTNEMCKVLYDVLKASDCEDAEEYAVEEA